LSVQNSHFDRNRPTRVLVHGWWEDDTSDIKVETASELLNYNDFNVLFIDWSEGSRTINYIGMKARDTSKGNCFQFLINYQVLQIVFQQSVHSLLLT
jgi:hypothetical protein